MTASIERVKCQSEVSSQSAVEHDGGQRVAPQRQNPNTAGFHRCERDQTQGVIDEMGRKVGQQHETRNQAYASNNHGGRLNLLRRCMCSPLSKRTDRTSVILSSSEESFSMSC